MATVKHAIVRYIALDKCFNNPYKKFSFDDLIEVCNEAICMEYGDDSGISVRTLREDIKFMRSEEGYKAPIEQITYMLFIKRLDELHTAKESKARILKCAIESPIFDDTEDQQKLRWGNFKDLEAEEMFNGCEYDDMMITTITAELKIMLK